MRFAVTHSITSDEMNAVATLDGGNIFSPLLLSRPALYELVIDYIALMGHATYWDRQAKSNEQTAYFSDFMPQFFSCCAGLSVTTVLSLDSTDSFFFFMTQSLARKLRLI